MDQNDAGIHPTESLLCGFPPMRGAGVHDPEQAFTGAVGFFSQHLMDQSAKRFDARRRFTPPQHVPAAHVPRGQILQGTTALVFVLDVGRAAWGGGQGGMTAATGLDAGLLVGTEDVVSSA